MKRLTSHLPRGVRLAVRDTGLAALDLLDTLRGARAPMSPPRRLARQYGGDAARVAARWRTMLIEWARLQPTSSVLDVGCGVGRIAVPLTGYLTTGRYEGFDLIREGIEWCQREVTPRHPNFRFQVADLYNTEYNPTGCQRAEEYTFPYPDGSFHVAWMASVATHMMPREMERYLAELARVLKPGGRALISWFLLNEESERALAEGRAEPRLVHRRDGYTIAEPDNPEAAVAFPEGWVRAAYDAAGFDVDAVRYGGWAGRTGASTYQDVVLAVRR